MYYNITINKEVYMDIQVKVTRIKPVDSEKLEAFVDVQLVAIDEDEEDEDTVLMSYTSVPIVKTRDGGIFAKMDIAARDRDGNIIPSNKNPNRPFNQVWFSSIIKDAVIEAYEEEKARMKKTSTKKKKLKVRKLN